MEKQSESLGAAAKAMSAAIRALPALLALIGVAGLVAYFSAPRTLADALASEMPVGDGLQVVSIERMEAGQPPRTSAVDPDSDLAKAIAGAVESSEAAFKRHEFGMKPDGVLYTLTVQDKVKRLNSQTLTLNDAGEAHVNATDTTYALSERETGLYDLCARACAAINAGGGDSRR